MAQRSYQFVEAIKSALGGDGQVTLGNTVMKGNARTSDACTKTKS